MPVRKKSQNVTMGVSGVPVLCVAELGVIVGWEELCMGSFGVWVMWGNAVADLWGDWSSGTDNGLSEQNNGPFASALIPCPPSWASA